MTFMAHQFGSQLYSLLLLLVAYLNFVQTRLQPSFPRFCDGRNRVHIISDKYDSKQGYSSLEEFVDLRLGKGAFIERNASSHRTIFTDAKAQVTYIYEPYSCQGYEFPKLPDSLLPEQDQARAGDKSRVTAVDDEGNQFDWYLFGVVDLWREVGWKKKVYQPTGAEFKDGADLRKHRWTVEEEDYTAEFTFHERKGAPDREQVSKFDLILRTITLKTSSEARQTTWNVHAIEFDLDDEVYHSQFERPLMYNCPHISSHLHERSAKVAARVERAIEKYHLKMEVSATKVVDEQTWLTDTMSLEFARTSPRDERLSDLLSSKPVKIRMIHQFNSRMDVKTVLDRNFNVKYRVDRLQGTCQLTNMGGLVSGKEAGNGNGDGGEEDEAEGGGEAEQEDLVGLKVEFSNGLEWDLSDKTMNLFFYDLKELELAKLLKNADGSEVAYFTGTKWNGADQNVRLVRKYSLWSDYRVELETVSVWILDGKQKLKEIFHFNILETNQLGILFAPQEARLFDISHECYVDNQELMKYGRDFIWLQLHYPVAAADQLRRLPQYTSGLEREFYHHIRYDANISHFRVPKMEFKFLDEGVGFTMRLLLLDSPPLHLIYAHVEGFLIEPDESDLVEVAASLDRCSDLCLLHRCEGMSYCRAEFSCVLSLSQDKLGAKLKYTELERGCTTFRKPKNFDDRQYYDTKLSNVVARLRRLGYSNDWIADIPAPPAGFDQSSEADGTVSLDPAWKITKDLKARTEYMNQVGEFLGKIGLKGFSVVRHLWGMSLQLIPNKVEFESSSSAALKGQEFDLEDDSPLLSFHKGLYKSRYNYRAFEQAESDQDTKRALRYMGIQYDQCTLACIDGKCSSFSYCKQRKECIITDIYEIRANNDRYILDEDPDCVIVQRDFLAKFNKFSGVRPAAANPSKVMASNPSECAHNCIVESRFNCLAFTFCKTTNQGSGSCVYTDSRLVEQNQLETIDRQDNCDHYTRSYLADFARLEFRHIKPEVLSEMQTIAVERLSVDKCAERCITGLMDCSAFQFCYDPQSQQPQQCVLIEKAAKDGASRVIEDKSGSSVFVDDQSCHVFSLRKDSNEAQLRHLALNDPAFGSQIGGPDVQTNYDDTKSLLVSIGSLFLLFCCSSLVFSTLGLTFLAVLRKNPNLQARIDRIGALFGRY